MKNNKKIFILSLLLASIQAYAGTVQNNMTTNATLNPTCSFSINNVAFGVFTPAATGGTKSSLTGTIICTKTTAPTLSVNGGNSGDPINRYMVGTGTNTDHLTYRITTGSIYSSPSLGDSTGGTMVTYDPSTKNVWNFTYNAWILNNQFITPDNYSDTLVATVTY